MAYKKKTMRKKYVKKRSFKKKRKTFKAKRAGNAQIRGKANKAVLIKAIGLMAIEQKDISSQTLPVYCTVGSVSVLNNLSGTGSSSPVQMGQYSSIYRNPQSWQTLKTALANYDEMRAVGFRIKYNLPAGSNFGGNNLVSLELVWDDNSVFNPLDPSTVNMAANSNYQNISLSANRNSVTRYYSLASTTKKLGLGWCNTKDIPSMIGTGGFTYFGQLNSPTSPSVGWRITAVGKIGWQQVYGYIELTWYYAFRGLNYGVAGGMNAMTGQPEQPEYEMLAEQDKPYNPGHTNGDV